MREKLRQLSCAKVSETTNAIESEMSEVIKGWTRTAGGYKLDGFHYLKKFRDFSVARI